MDRPDDVRIQTASPHDIAAVCRFGAAHIPGHYAPLIGEEAARRQVETWWNAERITAAVTAGRVVLARATTGLVGVAEWGPWEDDLVVWKLYVHPDRRGQGIGASLLQGIVDRLPPGTERLLVEHFAANERAAAFYEREGFLHLRTDDSPPDPAMAVVWRELALPRAEPRLGRAQR